MSARKHTGEDRCSFVLAKGARVYDQPPYPSLNVLNRFPLETLQMFLCDIPGHVQPREHRVLAWRLPSGLQQLAEGLSQYGAKGLVLVGIRGHDVYVPFLWTATGPIQVFSQHLMTK